MKIKKWKFKKTSPRRLLYLLAIIITCLLGLLVNKARLQFYKDSKEADQKFLSTHLKQDTEAARYYFYANYRLDTDSMKRANTIGQNASFINICKKESCALLGVNKKELLKACNGLSSKYYFNQHRVYNCNIKVTLENDQPLKCEAIDNEIFNLFCNKFIASL